MPQYAQATIIGHLGRDPELRYTPSGDAVLSCSIAVSRKRKGEDTTTWWRVSLFGKRAKVVAKYLRNGDPALFSGEPYTEEWEGQDGTKRQTLCLLARDFSFVGGKSEKQPADYQAPTESPADDKASFDDDIPF
jgi:single-strand DNA-binding protein